MEIYECFVRSYKKKIRHPAMLFICVMEHAVHNISSCYFL